MKTFSILIFLLVSFIARSQYADTAYTFASSTVLLSTSKGSGSGIIYQSKDSMGYLITANHVLLEQNNLRASDLKIVYYHGNPNYSPSDTLFVNLSIAQQMGQLSNDTINDIVVLKIYEAVAPTIANIPEYIKYTRHIMNIPKHFTFYQQKNIHEVEPTMDIYMLGYPKSLDFGNNYDFNKPILRKGVVAGVDIANNKIIIDCASYWGNSGGPIIGYDENNGKPYVIGIVSQFIPYSDYTYDKLGTPRSYTAVNSGYTAIIPISIGIDLTNKIKRLPQ